MSERTSVLSGLTLESVSLKSIEGLHPLVSAHLNRADVIPSNTMDLSEWTEQSVELLQAAAPPLLAKRIREGQPVFLTVSGADTVAVLKQFLPANACIPALILAPWLREDRLVSISAGWSIVRAALAAQTDPAAVWRQYEDACAQDANPFESPKAKATFELATQIKLPKL
jgi:hypothetical protein